MSATPAKTQAAKKVRRQKQFIAVGSLVLLALLGFQLPKLMRGSETAAPVTSAAPGSDSPLAAAPATLADMVQPVSRREVGQLLSFGLFKSKDPFVQQLSALTPVAEAQPAPSTPTTAEVPAPTATTTVRQGTATTSLGQGGLLPTVPNPVSAPVTTTQPGSTVPFPSTTPGSTPSTSPTPTTATSGAPSATPAATTPVAPQPTAVAISTNGFCETVSVNGTFPGDEDIFRVVSIAKDGKSVKLAVVGGAYDNGQASATLKMGEKLTLVNTADGTRYVISLRAKCDVQTTPVEGSTTTSPATTTTTTVAPVPPTTTVTTPIVTDSLDTTVPSG